MKEKFENELLRIVLDARIDSNNVNSIEETIEEWISSLAPQTIQLDARELQYISSAGLRFLLKLQKRFPEMKIQNVNNDVKDIFEITGFDQILDIEKARRSLSVEGKEVIGQGAYGEIFRLDPETIVKVYHHGTLQMIEAQTEIARKAFLKGVPSAICYDIVDVNGEYGAVYELIRSNTLAAYLSRHPQETKEKARELFGLLQILAAIDASDFIEQKVNDYYKDILTDYKERVSTEEWQELVEIIDLIPERKTLLHSDLHAGNIMLQDGELLLIDMDEMMQGHPIFDLTALNFCYGRVILSEAGVRYMKIPKESAQILLQEILDFYFSELNQEQRAKVMEALEMVTTLRHAVAATAFQRGKESEEARQARDAVEKDLKIQILGHKQEMEEGLALFPDITEIKRPAWNSRQPEAESLQRSID